MQPMHIVHAPLRQSHHVNCTAMSCHVPNRTAYGASFRLLHPSRRPSRRPPAAPQAFAADLEPGVVAAYGTLGASALGFVGVFAVAPRFRDQLKEDRGWNEIYEVLVKGGVKTVTAEDAYKQTSNGLARKYDQAHASGAVNVPLYNPISKWDIPSIIRRAGFAFFGIYGTELNRDFAAQAEAVLPKNKDIYVLCEMGGSLENKPGVSTGFQSRSLKAIYQLQEAGYRRLYHVKGGMIDWNVAQLPVED